MASKKEGEPDDATTDGELVAAMSSVEKTLFIFAFVILVASLAGASVFFSLENAGKKIPRTQSPKQPGVPDPLPAEPADPPPREQSYD